MAKAKQPMNTSFLARSAVTQALLSSAQLRAGLGGGGQAGDV